jgi:hypothetical protein
LSEPCIIPVAAADAIAWAEGRLDDHQLVLRAQLVPEAVFIVNLPDLASYRQILRAAAYWRGLGAVCLITRTGTEAVARHLDKKGCLATLKELTPPEKSRYFAPPAAFGSWIDSLRPK